MKKISFENDDFKFDLELKKPLNQTYQSFQLILENILNTIDEDDWFVMIGVPMAEKSK